MDDTKLSFYFKCTPYVEKCYLSDFELMLITFCIFIYYYKYFKINLYFLLFSDHGIKKPLKREMIKIDPIDSSILEM